MSTYGKLPINPFKGISFNAGTLLSNFNPATGTLVRSNIIGATTGGSNFNPNLNIISLFEDIDNAQVNTKQGQLIKGCDPHLTTTLLTASPDNIGKLVPNSTVVTADTLTTVVPADGVIPEENFFDLWLLTDYATMDTGAGGTVQGFFAIHMMNCIDVNGLQGQTSDSGKTQFSCDFRAFYDADDESQTPPYEIYMRVPSAITVTTQPTDMNVPVGSDATFTVAATTDVGSLTYQWQVRGSGDSSYSNISGATLASYTQEDCTLEDAGNDYRCKITNGTDTVYSKSAHLYVRQA